MKAFRKKTLSLLSMSLIVWACSQPTQSSKPETEQSAAECIDPKKVDPNGICTMDYTPVCGCDNKTYGNACQAEKSGVLRWESGECK